ncbi:MAG TPA: hypothetical protein VN633_18145, partial [Bryobacteraceae bacterium]|nr:hypothetical protein [Bryobacteraceae bacterium]
MTPQREEALKIARDVDDTNTRGFAVFVADRKVVAISRALIAAEAELQERDKAVKVTRNSEALANFTKYCEQHPHERFWQALRNWSRWA